MQSASLIEAVQPGALPPEEARRLQALVRICDGFQAHSPTIPLAMAEAFLLVALNEGKSLRELCAIAGQPQSTMNRHLLDLGDRNRRMEPGLGLVEWRLHPRELRRKQYLLSPKGRKLLQEILGHLANAEGGT
jgi:DNA-binding MarR family transcriptional regulator